LHSLFLKMTEMMAQGMGDSVTPAGSAYSTLNPETFTAPR